MDGKTDVLIVGAGFAGASTAFHLSTHFSGKICIVEKEKLPGFHASGRNASLLLQSTQPAAIRALTAASRRAYETHAQKIDFRQTGSLLLGTPEQLQPLREPALLPSEFRTAEQICGWIPALEGHRLDTGLWTPSDGVIDISRLLDLYLRGARDRGVKVYLDTDLRAIEGQGPFRVTTSQGELEAAVLVNAAGAWAPEIARQAGIEPLPMFPLKRHLFVLDDVPGPLANLPFVWSLAEDFYFRPESGGLLFSICDEEPAQSLEPTVNGEVSEDLAELIWKHLPALREAVQRKVWSCFRTKTPDDQFVIGWDRRNSAFFWVAGLGGHGMGCSWEAGRLAAAALSDPSYPLPLEFQPSRASLSAGGLPGDAA